MKTPHEILGVKPDATPEEVKHAYKKLANKHHPDKHQGDKAQEEKFKEINAAYEAITNPKPNNQQGFGGHTFNDMHAAFEQMARNFHRQMIFNIQVELTLEEAFSGTTKLVQLNSELGHIEALVPPGTLTGDAIGGTITLPNGDTRNIRLIFVIRPHQTFKQAGNDLVIEHSVSVFDLIGGGKVPITDLDGKKYEVNIKPGTQPNSKLRLKGKGFNHHGQPRGDIWIIMLASIPELRDEQINKIMDIVREK